MDALPRETLKLEKIHRFKSLKMVEVDLKTKLDPNPFGADHGKLENGLTYYVRCNSKPQMRAALALAVKVGFVLPYSAFLCSSFFLFPFFLAIFFFCSSVKRIVLPVAGITRRSV